MNNFGIALGLHTWAINDCLDLHDNRITSFGFRNLIQCIILVLDFQNFHWDYTWLEIEINNEEDLI